MFSGTFLLVCGVTSLASLILSLPTTNDILERLPPELAEILLGENIGSEVWESVINDAEHLSSVDPDDPIDPGFNLQRPEARTFANLFNFSAIIAGAPNDTAAITLVPLITILANLFNKTG